MTFRYSLLRNWHQLLGLAGAVLGGVALGIVVPAIVSQSLYRLAMITLGMMLVFGLLVSRAPQLILVVFLAFVIPLNLAFTPFGDPPYAPVIYLYDLPLFALLGIWCFQALLRNHPIQISRLELVAMAFILWCVFSLYNSPNHTLTALELVRMIKLLLMARVVSTIVTTKAQLRVVLIAMVIGLMLQSVFSFLQFSFQFDLGGLGFTVGDVRRVSGTVGWPNTLGAYAAAINSILIAIWICDALPKYRLWIMLAVGLGVLPLAFSLSRGAWVGMAASVLFMYLLGVRRGWISIGRLALQVGVLVILVTALGVTLSEQVRERSAENTLGVRELLNRIAFNMIEANPVVGVGLNTFVLSMPAYDPWNVHTYFPYPVHNVFLLFASETGLIGLGLFLLLIVMALRRAWFVARRGDRFLSATMIGIMGGMAAILVSNLTDVHLLNEVPYATWWLFIGLIIGLSKGLKTQAATATDSAARVEVRRPALLAPSRTTGRKADRGRFA